MNYTEVPIVNRIVERHTGFVEIESDHHQAAFDTACVELVRKYPGTRDTIEVLKSMVQRTYLSSKRKKG